MWRFDLPAFPIWDSGERASWMGGVYGGGVPQTPRIVAKLRPEGPRETWGLYLPDEQRWLDLLFVRELDARRFSRDLMDGSTAA